MPRLSLWLLSSLKSRARGEIRFFPTINLRCDPADLTNIVRSKTPASKTDPSTEIAHPGPPFPELAEAILRPSSSSRKRPGRFIVATAEHDPLIRVLLRDNPMPGPIRISLEREPNYFAGAKIDGQESTTILSIENGRAVSPGRPAPASDSSTASLLASATSAAFASMLATAAGARSFSAHFGTSATCTASSRSATRLSLQHPLAKPPRHSLP